MDVRLGDVLVMKKAHPCGSKEWKVLRTGMDFRLKCLGCGHEVLIVRGKAEKNIKSGGGNEKSLDGEGAQGREIALDP